MERAFATVQPKGSAREEDSLEFQFQHLSPLDAFKAKGRYLHDQLRRENAHGRSVEESEKLRRESTDSVDAFAFDHKLQTRKSSQGARAYAHVMERSANHSRSSTSRSQTPSELANSTGWTSGHSSPSSSVYSLNSFAPALPETPAQSEHASPRSQSERVTQNYSRPRQSRRPSCESSAMSSPSTPQRSHLDRSSERARTRTPKGPVSANTSPNGPQGQQRGDRIPSISLVYEEPPKPEGPIRSRPATTAMGSAGRPPGGSRTPSTYNNTRVASMPDAALDAATHIELGIEQHEANQLPQSTHHFKVAADSGDPTGCLLYGLALRHGWGVRPDLARSIAMLKRAADSVAPAGEGARDSKLFAAAPLSQDLGVALYELGVSYRHGWGVVADKKLSLKYIELACELGDVEAMVDAADCHLTGTGCKKDKATAARYLRRAEAKGKKEIGNSWIWKAKYDGD